MALAYWLYDGRGAHCGLRACMSGSRLECSVDDGIVSDGKRGVRTSSFGGFGVWKIGWSGTVFKGDGRRERGGTVAVTLPWISR